jgi:N-acetylglutamate synthase-like GNAT family acetyltransferase
MSALQASLRIRPATSADIAAIDRLLAASYPALLKADYPPSVIVAAVPLISRAQPALVTCGTYFVAECDGIIAAAGGWTNGAPKGGLIRPGRGHIRHVGTDHRQVRRGCGRALLTHVLASARTAGMVEIEALSTLTAAPFYAAMGFRAVEEVSIALGPAALPFPAIRMERAL